VGITPVLAVIIVLLKVPVVVPELIKVDGSTSPLVHVTVVAIKPLVPNAMIPPLVVTVFANRPLVVLMLP
jgi:hypothetical protein